MKISKILLGLAFLASGTANAATVFAPTDGDVNFLFATLGGGTLAMFDDTDQSYVGAKLTISTPEIVGFTGPINANNDFFATGTNGVLNLIGSSQFILGLDTGGGNWIADSSVVSVGANAFQVSFDNNGTLVTVDVQIIPVPPAVWLFGSGLLGLVGIARRRKAA